VLTSVYRLEFKCKGATLAFKLSTAHKSIDLSLISKIIISSQH